MLSRFLAVVRKGLRSLFRFRVKAGHGKSAAHGRRDDLDDGSVSVGVAVPLKPPPPVLVGKEAKPIPRNHEADDESNLAA